MLLLLLSSRLLLGGGGGDSYRCVAGLFSSFVFVNVCRQDYIGADDIASESKMIHKSCKCIGKLRMEYKAKVGNRMVIDTSDELYGKFISIVAGLPDDTVN